MESMSHPRNRSRKECITQLGACLVFITLGVISGAAAGNIELKKHYIRGGHGNPNAFSVTDICSKILYPEVCNNMLSSSNANNLQNCVAITMKVAMVAIKKSLEAVHELQSSSPIKSRSQYSTLDMCNEVLTNCLEQVNTSFLLVSSLNQQPLQPEFFKDLEGYMPVAITNQGKCLIGVQNNGVWKASDALNGTHSTSVTKLLSNALSLAVSLLVVTN